MMYHIIMRPTHPSNEEKPMPTWLLQHCRPICVLLLGALLVAGQAATLAHEADPWCDENLCQLCEGGVGEPLTAPAAFFTQSSDTSSTIIEALVASGHSRGCSVTMARAPPVYL